MLQNSDGSNPVVRFGGLSIGGRQPSVHAGGMATSGPKVDALTVRLTLELWVQSKIEQLKRAADPSYLPPVPPPHAALRHARLNDSS